MRPADSEEIVVHRGMDWVIRARSERRATPPRVSPNEVFHNHPDLGKRRQTNLNNKGNMGVCCTLVQVATFVYGVRDTIFAYTVASYIRLPRTSSAGAMGLPLALAY